MLNKNGFAGIVILVVGLLVLVGGGYAVYSIMQNSNSDNENTTSQEMSNQADNSSNNSDTSANSDIEDTSIKNLIIKGWQKYSNADVGFSIDYPTDWQIEDLSNSTQYQYIVFSPADFLNGIVEVEVATSLSNQAICGSNPCSKSNTIEVTVGSNTSTVETYYVEGTYGYPYYAFLTEVNKSNDDSLYVLVKYAIPQHLDGIKAMLKTFSFM